MKRFIFISIALLCFGCAPNFSGADIHYKENSFDYNDSMIFTVVNEENNQNNNNA